MLYCLCTSYGLVLSYVFEVNMENNKGKEFYKRGTGLKVVICSEDDPEADYYIQVNQAAGNTVYKDNQDNLFILACQYSTCEG